MLIERAPQPDRRLLRWIGTVGLSMSVGAWLLLVLDFQYRVAWLRKYDVAADALFLVGLTGIALARSLERWGTARVRAVLLRIAFSIAVFCCALVAAELAARRVFPTAVASAGPSVSLNALGFREREIGPKAPNHYRIAVIGDSFTFGNGVEEKDRFSNLLQQFLGQQYEVLNFGHPGNNLPEHLNGLDVALKVQPDFVLLQLYENDFETEEMTVRRPRAYPLLPPDVDTWIGSSSVIYRLLIDHWNQIQEAAGFTEGYTHYMERHLRNPQTSDALRTSGLLMQFIERTRAAGVQGGGVLFPALYGLAPHDAHYPFDYLNDRVSKIYFDEQTPYLDLLPAFMTVRDPPSLWVSRFDPHPNAKANRLAAIAMLNRFLPIWQH